MVTKVSSLSLSLLLLGLIQASTPVLAETGAEHYRAAHESALRQAPSSLSKQTQQQQNHHKHIARSQQHASSTERPQIRDKEGETEEERAERWAKYVPRRLLTDEVELSEARRLAREREVIRAAQREQQEKASRNAQAPAAAMALPSAKKQASSAISRSERQTRRFYNDDDGEDDDSEEDEDAEKPSTKIVKKAKRTARRTIEASSPDGHSGVVHVVLSLFWIAYSIVAWFSKRVVWTPTTYAAHAVSWAAQTSWRTTRWTGERALVAPALTVGAPLIYLGQGALFLFVYLPARFIAIIVRELYPVYVFLGAGLAVGTAMGIVAALVLYIGSFVLGDSSRVEADLQRRAHDALPEVLDEETIEARRRRQRQRKSAAFKWGKGGESVIERAMREREQQAQKRQSHFRQLNGQMRDMTSTGLGEDGHRYKEKFKQQERQSDEEDDEEDYFGGGVGGRSSASYQAQPPSRGTSLAPSASAGSASSFGNPNWQAPASRILPQGATAQGGWSGSSSPATSPSLTRISLPNTGPLASARSPLSSLGASPIVSPVASRQRRI